MMMMPGWQSMMVMMRQALFRAATSNRVPQQIAGSKRNRATRQGETAARAQEEVRVVSLLSFE
jgi:hypothetical protein